MRRYRTVIFVVALIIINVLGLSFTVVNKGSYENSLYHRFTRQRFAWIVSDPHPKYPIQAGWANVTITPIAASSPGAKERESIQTRALVLDNGTTRAAMITVDLLMMPPSVAQLLEKRLPKLGLAWKNVYLGATYSQPGLGGWSRDYMGKRQFGPYDEQRVNQVTEAILKAVDLAQKNMGTVQIGHTQVDLNGQKELSAPDNRAGAEALHLLQLRKLTGESALIYSSYARPIPIGKATDSAAKGDFFSLSMQQLDKQTHCFTLGMVGAIQETNPSNQIRSETPQALATQIATILSRQELHTDSTLIAQTTPLIQNDPQVRVSQNWRLKPWLAKALYGDYRAELKALRIGQTVFVGCPGSISAELADDLLDLPIARQRTLVITSYNGGDIGQIVPDTYYYAENSPYAISQTNRFGPYTARFFEDMTQSLVSSLK
ncbi:hypothetical protein [Spirosoma validum]|uniref:Neutral/alkaline non-lysosomal ceramidase N-terminal domain-containing protein n=1 Tax=Spirosoma validum TaxID=2771355 RepID=A0A927AXN2_9BACT|nr:hypothetical protein [Spirosoma validum]MBD2751668.1 hypothetical protein [Spirosoma validum]